MLSYIISSIIMPPGLFIVILLILSLYALKKPRRITLSIFMSLLALTIYITSIPLTAFFLNKWFIDIYKPELPPEHEKAAIIVLAAGSSNDENGKPFQPAITTMERLFVGIKLAKEHPAFSYLILSGGDVMRHHITEAEVMSYAAKTMGCKATIILEQDSRNTDENLKYCSKIVQKLNVKNVILVTNNSHIRRSMDFAHLYMPKDVKVYPYPSGGQQPRKITIEPKLLIPSFRALDITRSHIKEIIGLLLT